MTAQIPKSPDPLIDMAEGLRGILATIDDSREDCVPAKDRATLDLAIRVAEIIANNPRGFRQWAKLTSGVVL